MTRNIADKYQVIDFCCGHPFTHKDVIATWVAALNEDRRDSLLVSVSNLRAEWCGYDEYWDGVLRPEQILKMSSASAAKKLRARTGGRKALMVFLFPPFSGPYRRIWRKFKSLGYEIGFLFLSPPRPQLPVTGKLSLKGQVRGRGHPHTHTYRGRACAA